MTPPAAEQIENQVRFLLSAGTCVLAFVVLFVFALAIGMAAMGGKRERYK